MIEEQIQKLCQRFEGRVHEHNDVECGLSRKFPEQLGYTKWRNGEVMILDAKTAWEKAVQPVANHFADISKMVQIGLQIQSLVVVPESQPAAQDVKKVEWSLKAEQNKVPWAASRPGKDAQ